VCAHVAAPLDFTSRVMARVAAEPILDVAPALQLAGYEAPVEDSPFLHQAGAVFATIGAATLVVLGSSFVATLANPSLGLTVVSALINVAVMALAALRLAGEAFTNVATNAGLTTAVMTLLLGGVLLGWAQVSRIFTRSTQEA
jgi:negative regulator of sigma E activity